MWKVGRQVVVAIVVAAFFLIVCPLEAEIVQKCNNVTEGFTIEFPPGWLLRENPGDGISLVAFRPPEEAGESVYERMEVVSLKDTGEDFEAFLQKRIAALQTTLPAFALVASGSEEFSDFSVGFVTYTFADHFFTLKVLAQAQQWIVRRNDRAYLITAKATVESFPKYEGIFREIAGSFRLIQ
jgi:hypothetical protein